MNKKLLCIFASAMLAIIVFAGCGQVSVTQVQTDNNQNQASAPAMPQEKILDEGLVPVYAESIKSGVYTADVLSSSTMFNVESCELRVEGGSMTADMTMSAKGDKYVFLGSAEDAQAAPAEELIEPVVDPDGFAHFTLPVEALDKSIAIAVYSESKEKWADRKILFSTGEIPLSAYADGYLKDSAAIGLEDGEYTIEVNLIGGSGRASIESPAKLTVSGGKAIAAVKWSSDKYDYMIVDLEMYKPVTTEGGSVFEIPVGAFDYNLSVKADTTAMSAPHEIPYKLYFDSETIKNK